MADGQTELRFYARNREQVPQEHGFYAIQTVRRSSVHEGREYINNHSRTGWLMGSPEKKTAFKNREEMERWIDGVVAGP